MNELMASENVLFRCLPGRLSFCGAVGMSVVCLRDSMAVLVIKSDAPVGISLTDLCDARKLPLIYLGGFGARVDFLLAGLDC
jgi:hypothetical protein